MANLLSRSLARLFRDRSSLTSLKKLQREGIKTVSVLDLSALEDLVEQAVTRAVHDSSPQTPLGRELAGQVQAQLLRLLGQRDDLERTNQTLREEQQSLAGNRVQVEEALKRAREELQRNVSEHDRELLKVLETDLEQGLERILDPLHERVEAIEPRAARLLRALRQPLRELGHEILCSALRQSTGGESGEKIELLRRRVAKLSASLDDAQSMMTRLSETNAAKDSGVPSLYKQAQGLSGKENDFAERRQLMKQIFQLNMQLRESIVDPQPKDSSTAGR